MLPLKRGQGCCTVLNAPPIWRVCILLIYLFFVWLVFAMCNLYIKFEVSIFIHSRDVRRFPNFKKRSHDQDYIPFRYNLTFIGNSCHDPPMTNLNCLILALPTMQRGQCSLVKLAFPMHGRNHPYEGGEI